jgi:hypothetical protein
MAGHCPTFSYKPLHIPGGQCPMPYVSEDKSVENGKWYSNFRVAPTKPRLKYKCIIENVWKVIKTKVQRRIDDIQNTEDLKTCSWSGVQISATTVFRSSAFRMSSIRRWTFVFITFHTFSIIHLHLSLGFVGATLKLEYHFPFSTDLSSEIHGMGHCPPGICRGL